MKKQMVSVIVPIFKVDNGLLVKCIDSILAQTYRNIEVLLVNDATNEENESIINAYVEKYENVKEVKHEVNKGLFQARLSGIAEAKGDYIAFVDADDYLTVDWFRLLVKKAIEEKADIVMGNTICQNEDGYQYVYNMSVNFLKDRATWKGEEIFDNMMEDEGKFFQLHTVWNKLYSKCLWNRALSFFQTVDTHLIMTEDILFSFVLFYYARRMAFSNHDGYFYYRNAQSSTFDTNSIGKIKKNIKDIMLVFDSVKTFMIEHGVFEKYEGNYQEWKNRYFRWWSVNVENATSDLENEEHQATRQQFLDYFEKDGFEYPIPEDDSFNLYTSAWNGGYENIKMGIVSENTDVVSFDIFDTLILRPLLEPEDVFEIIQWENPIHGNFNFKRIRKLSESMCRRQFGLFNSQIEDVTLDQIYDTMGTVSCLTKDEIEKYKKLEEDTEVSFTYARKAGKELYELANYVGKKIILVSDMYMTEKVVNRILEKSGYTLHEKLYLSSEAGKLKATGKLYEEARKDYPADQFNMIHIGDNWNSDFIVSKNYGINSYFIPKTKDILFNTLGDKYTGNAIGYAVKNFNSCIDLSNHLKQLPVRCMYAVVANKLFDNPFIAFNEQSDYNGDPYMIGGLAVGMHLFGIAMWLQQEAKANNKGKINFTSRDGYYLQKAYDTLRAKWYPNAAESNYVHISRKSLIPIDVQNAYDVYAMLERFEWRAQSPESIMKMYETVLSEPDAELIREFRKEGIVFDEKFKSEEECLKFLAVLARTAFNEEKAVKSMERCASYFRANIGENDIFFDLGYSGKLQDSIVKALGYSVDGYYLHTNGFEAATRQQNCGYKIKSFYDFVPSMSGAISEFILSDYRGSCIGYKEEKGRIKPVLEDLPINLINKYVVEEIHRGAANYLGELLRQFESHKNLFEGMHCMDTALQYEKFLMCEKAMDRELFRCCQIEDEYYGGVAFDRLLNVWNWQLGDRQVLGREEVIYRVVEQYVPVAEAPVVEETVAEENRVEECTTEVAMAEVLSQEESMVETQLEEVCVQEVEQPAEREFQIQMIVDGEEVNAEDASEDSEQVEYNIYEDGVLVKTFERVNKSFPMGSKRRAALKKMVGIFVK